MPKHLRLGIAIAGDRIAIAAVDQHGALSGHAEVLRSGDLKDDLRVAFAQRFISAVGAVMLTSDHLERSLSERSELARVGVLRIGAPVASGISIMAEWPQELVSRIRPSTRIIEGAVNTEGERLVDLDEGAVERTCRAWRGEIDALAVSGMFSTVAPEDELRVAEIARRVLGSSIPLTLSHTVSGLGLLERENTAILNAALAPIMAGFVDDVEQALADLGIEPWIFVAQNDGTLLDAEAAKARPVHLFEGPFASAMLGVGRLMRLQDAIVVESGTLGGEADRVGVLRNGVVAMNPRSIRIAGVRLNIELPVGAVRVQSSARIALQIAQHQSPNAPVVEVREVVTGEEEPLPADVAMAFGVATAPVSATVWHVVSNSEGAQTRLQAAKQQAVDNAIRAGADPTTISVTVVEELDFSHTSIMTRRVRVRAIGMPMLLSALGPETGELSYTSSSIPLHHVKEIP